LYIISLQYKKTICSYDTALYPPGLPEQKPVYFTAAVPRGYKADYKEQSPLKKIMATEEYYSMGMDTANTPYG